MGIAQSSSGRFVTKDSLLPVIGRDMEQKLPLLKTFARSQETLLIRGPTGAGKTRIAKWIQANSRQNYQAFEVLDLSTTPDEMKMAALFGWKKGAFTGAAQSNPGAVGRALEGTLFIDEVDKLSLQAQAGLLQLLDEGHYQPLGDTAPARKANIRFIIGTNTNLQALVKKGEFREDLYFRINVLPITLLPLSQRVDEICLWAEFMLSRCAKENGFEGYVALNSATNALLESYSWPGNLRQLETIIRRAFAITRAQSHSNKQCEVDVSQIQQALLMEEEDCIGTSLSETGSLEQQLMSSIWNAAEKFVVLAMKKEQQQQKLGLGLTEVFKGCVLKSALSKLMDKKRVYQLFGREKAILNRTYQRELRKELQRLEEIESTLINR